MVQRVRIILGLQSNAGILPIVHAALAMRVQIIAGVELNAGAVGVDRHTPTGDRVMELGTGVAEDLPVVVIAALQLKTFIILMQVPGDWLGRPEIHRRSLHAALFAGGNILGVRRGEEPAGQGQHLLHGGIGVLVAAQIEVAVVSEVEHGVLVTDSIVYDVQAAGGIQRIGHADLGISGKALIAVGAVQLQNDFGAGVGNELPKPLEIEVGAGVQIVAVFVGRQAAVFVSKTEGRALNAVGAASDGCAQTAVAVCVAYAVVKAQHHVSQIAGAVGNQQGDQRRTVVSNPSGDAAAGYCVEAGFLTGWQNAEKFSHGNCSFHFSRGNTQGYVKVLFEIIL